jgi:hypothetical protein
MAKLKFLQAIETDEQLTVGKAAIDNTPCVRNIIIGTDDPNDDLGSEGDIYLKYEE